MLPVLSSRYIDVWRGVWGVSFVTPELGAEDQTEVQRWEVAKV